MTLTEKDRQAISAEALQCQPDQSKANNVSWASSVLCLGLGCASLLMGLRSNESLRTASYPICFGVALLLLSLLHWQGWRRRKVLLVLREQLERTSRDGSSQAKVTSDWPANQAN